MQLSEPRKKRIIPTRNRFLDWFAGEVEGFNNRPLNLNDLEYFCLQHDIEFVETPFRRLHGIAIGISQYDFIYLNSLILQPERIIAGYHELFHVVHHLGTSNRAQCYSEGRTWNLSKDEYQAQAAGVVALMPDRLVVGQSVEDLMREFEVSRRIAEFRLYLTYG